MTAWYCTWCGKEHNPDSTNGGFGAYTQPDPRYAVGLCGKTRTVLVADQAEADLAAHRRGKYRPKVLTEPPKADDLVRKAGLRP